MFSSYNLLGKPYAPSNTTAKLPFLVLSHSNRIPSEDLKLLGETGTAISSTPGTESQMNLGYPVALDPELKTSTANVSLGIDCHANDPASIPAQGRLLLQLARAVKNEQILDKDQVPSYKVTGNSEEVFNLATIRGARCLGLEDSIGSIKVGKRADLVVFDATNSVGLLSAAEYDPLVAVLRFSEPADIEYVLVDGVIKKQRGKLAPVDLKQAGDMEWSVVAGQVRRSQKEIQKRIDGMNLEKGREIMLSMFHVDQTRLVDGE
jgi:cytosine/adenosine deaminase-related metal-dependent hydrolase